MSVHTLLQKDHSEKRVHKIKLLKSICSAHFTWWTVNGAIMGFISHYQQLFWENKHHCCWKKPLLNNVPDICQWEGLFFIFINFSFLLKQSACAAGYLKVFLLECPSFWLFSILHWKKTHQPHCSYKSLHVSASRLKYKCWSTEVTSLVFYCSGCLFLHLTET